jgi:hypothetical protein
MLAFSFHNGAAEFSTLLGYCTMSLCDWCLTFWDSLMVQ